MLKPIIDSLPFIVSNSCRSEFQKKINILQIIEEAWKKDFKVTIVQKTASKAEISSHSDAIETDNLNDLMKKLQIKDISAATQLLSVPQKRRLVEPDLTDLTLLACTALEEECQEFVDTLDNLQRLWSQQQLISIEVTECTASCLESTPLLNLKIPQSYRDDNDFSEPDGDNLSGLSNIHSPKSVKIKGKPRLGMITTPVQSRRKKLPVPFVQRTQLQQIQEMLTWLINQDLVMNVLDSKYCIKKTDLNLGIYNLRDSFHTVNIQLI
ncbi:uncharacterized protein LOC107036239 [Diachasma alloeum]|uniref:uncharacterized protein LOC107036239 n=1 Tax=Diachasma alloeum TaxID=454923 RepID=UPI000738298D|nr:uncharacterized protein LOC107036239 [Diachasma alloeum]